MREIEKLEQNDRYIYNNKLYKRIYNRYNEI